MTASTDENNDSNRSGSGLSLNQFVMQVNERLWPEFDHGEVSMDATGVRHVDLLESVQKRWAGGGYVGPEEFGTPLFVASACPKKRLPSRVFDLMHHQVIKTSQFKEAIELMKSGNSGKIVLNWGNLSS